jgi:hypothetical protein
MLVRKAKGDSAGAVVDVGAKGDSARAVGERNTMHESAMLAHPGLREWRSLFK